jgi:hypothetical protein
MPLTDPVPLLRVINKSNHVSKILVGVQPGDELEVSEDVKRQIYAQNGDFTAAEPDPEPAEPETETEPVDVKPAKRAAKRKAQD